MTVHVWWTDNSLSENLMLMKLTIHYLHAVFIDVYVVARWTVTSLTEKNEFFEKKDVSQTFLPAVQYDKLGLPQQHPLFL